MTTLNITGRENIVQPALYIPNRLSIAAGKALHKLLDNKVCYLVDPSFKPAKNILHYAESKGVHIEYFDFRHTTSRAVREQILDQLERGNNVVFVPGALTKSKGCLSDVPAPFLRELGSLHISPVPVFLGHYGDTLLTLFCEEDDNCRQELCIMQQLSPGPQIGERMLSAWMQKGAELYSAHPMLCGSLTTALVKSMAAHPNVTVTDGMTDQELPFFKVLGVSMAVAKKLKELGQRRIGVILPPGPGGIIATLACMLAGVTPVIINYASSGQAFESTVRQAGLTRFITARKFMQKLPTFAWPDREKLILVEDMLSGLSKATLVKHALMAKMMPAAVICKLFNTDAHKNNDEAIMLFTSGSSGEPKGVALSHRMLLCNVAQCINRLVLAGEERFLGSLPIFHSFGLTVTMLLPLLCGFPICSYPNPTDARTLCELIKKYSLTLVCSTPTFARSMLRRADESTFRSVHYFIVGAEKLPPDVEDEFKKRCGVQLLEGYGLTEASPVCCVNLPMPKREPGLSFYIPSIVRGSIGAVFPGLAVRITDPDDDTRELPISERGMIWFKGSNIFTGYVGKEDMNSEIFSKGWFKTGDLGHMDLNGFIYLGGRLSRFSKVGGEMVPHEGVEQAICKALELHPADDGLQIAVTGVSDKQKGEALVLLSALPQHRRSSMEKESLSQIREALIAANIPNLYAPKYIVPVESIPVLPTGKLDLRACKLLAEEALHN